MKNAIKSNDFNNKNYNFLIPIKSSSAYKCIQHLGAYLGPETLDINFPLSSPCSKTQWFEFVMEIGKSKCSKGLGHDICHLIVCRKKINLNNIGFNKLPNKVIVKLDMHSPSMEFWICNKIDYTYIVTP